MGNILNLQFVYFIDFYNKFYPRVKLHRFDRRWLRNHRLLWLLNFLNLLLPRFERLIDNFWRLLYLFGWHFLDRSRGSGWCQGNTHILNNTGRAYDLFFDRLIISYLTAPVAAVKHGLKEWARKTQNKLMCEEFLFARKNLKDHVRHLFVIEEIVKLFVTFIFWSAFLFNSIIIYIRIRSTTLYLKLILRINILSCGLIASDWPRIDIFCVNSSFSVAFDIGHLDSDFLCLFHPSNSKNFILFIYVSWSILLLLKTRWKWGIGRNEFVLVWLSTLILARSRVICTIIHDW